MQTDKSNGHTKPHGLVKLPEVAVSTSGPPVVPDPFDQMRAVVKKMGDKRYAEGYRRAVHAITVAVSSLDTDTKLRLAGVFDQLESELYSAEAAAK